MYVNKFILRHLNNLTFQNYNKNLILSTVKLVKNLINEHILHAY